MGKKIEITKEELNAAGMRVFMDRVRSLTPTVQAEEIFKEFKENLHFQMLDEKLETLDSDSFEARLEKFLEDCKLDKDVDSQLILNIQDLKNVFLNSLGV